MTNGFLTDMQIERLLKGVGDNRVAQTRGMSYIPQHEVRAELTRVFGFGNWDSTVHDVTLLYEDQREGTTDATKGKMYWFAGYRLAVTLRIRDYDGNQICEFTEYHAEENAPQPNRGEAHALALTACESYALRRAAIGLGDRFGLSLYNFGSTAPMVRGSLQQLERANEKGVDSDATVPEPTTQVTDAEAQVARAFSQDDALSRAEDGDAGPVAGDTDSTIA